jgi:thymidylate kinase
MQIELTGCTGAGKSTLADGICRVCKKQGIDLQTSRDFVLGQIRLNWVKNHLARTLLLDLYSLFTCLVTCKKYFRFYIFTFQTIFRLPVAWPEKLNLARNVLKKIGVYEIIRRRSSCQQLVLADEGTVHTAHNLFIHTSAQVDDSYLSTFAKLVPLPDMVIYVAQSESVLIKRAMERGHKRIPNSTLTNTVIFITRAINVFEKVLHELVIEKRLFVAESKKIIVITQNQHHDPLIGPALEIVSAGIDSIISNDLAQARI